MFLTTEYRCSSAKTVVSGGGGMLWACNLNTATLLLLNANSALTVDALKMTVQQCIASKSLSAQLTLVLTGITGIILIRRGGGGGGGVQPGPMVNQRGVLGEAPAAVLTAVRPLAAVNAPVLREDVRVGEGCRTICTLVRPLAGVRVAVILQALAGDEGLRAAVAGEQRAGVQAAVVLQIGRGVEAFAAVVTQVVQLLFLGLAAAAGCGCCRCCCCRHLEQGALQGPHYHQQQQQLYQLYQLCSLAVRFPVLRKTAAFHPKPFPAN
ncbi:hypothetical protein TYRP_021092 [Tyrophagus putrescentiae]|nr:hypothetical protein TYRP_021092 [Tyrophagus putrescentiae]